MVAANANKLQTLVLQRLAISSNREASKAIAVDESKLSRFTTGGAGLTLEQVAALFEHLGITAAAGADGDLVTVPRRKYEALRTLAREGLEDEQ